MTACRDIVPLLSPYADGELASDDREFVDDHVRGCDRCTLRLALVRAQGDALRGRLGEAADRADYAAMTEGILARVRRETPLRGGERRRVWARETFGAHRRAFAAVAGMAVAASIAAVVALSPSATPAPEQLAQIDEVDFGSHDGAVLDLPHDTTVIWVAPEDGT